MFGPLRRVKFLITAPFIVLMLFVINLMTSPGEWWVQWAAFGIGIAWVINLFKLIRDIVVLGGLAAFGAYIFNRNRSLVRLRQGYGETRLLRRCAASSATGRRRPCCARRAG